MNDKLSELQRLTQPDEIFANKIAENINKDYPDTVLVIDKCCYVPKKYYQHIKDLVRARYKLKVSINNG